MSNHSTSHLNLFALSLSVFIMFTSNNSIAEDQKNSLDIAAEKYVRLGLELGQYDPDYVDAYLGPEDWRPTKENSRSKEKIASDIAAFKSSRAKMSF